MEGDEGFYGGAKIRWQRLDRVEGSLDPIGQQQFANAGLMRAKLVAEAFGSRSSSETSEFGSGHFDATDTNATPYRHLRCAVLAADPRMHLVPA
jgi:hypothetical protein